MKILGTTLYTVLEVAEMLNVSRITVVRYIQSERLKATKIGGQWRITEKALKEFIGDQ